METLRHRESRKPQGWVSLRYLIPALLLVTLVTDVALRFVPPERVAFRAWEAAGFFATAEGWFKPNFRYRNDHSFGDLPTFGNLPRFRQYRRESFTTDEFGFRNPRSEGREETPAAILVGDSFAVGADVSDEDTLSEQLMSRLSNMWVYNGAAGEAQWRTTNELIQRLHMHGGLVIWEVLERLELPESVQRERSDFSEVGRMIARPNSGRYRALRSLKRWAESFLSYSPLRISLTRSFRSVENGIWVPNPSKDNVLVGELQNGESMLFFPGEVDNFYRPHYDGVTYLSQVSALVHSSGNQILVVLIPDKYTVYYPLLSEKGQSFPDGESRLDYLEKALIRSGVPVINLTPQLRAQAAEGLQRREYNYWIDDTHWNRAGIQIGVTEILRAWNGRSSSTVQIEPIAPAASDRASQRP